MTTMELIERGIGHNCLSDAYEMGKADGIDEFLKECRDRTSHYLDGEPFKYMRELMDIAKYLKEQKEQKVCSNGQICKHPNCPKCGTTHSMSECNYTKVKEAEEMSDEELMHIAFADKRTVQEILRSIFDIGVQQGKTDAYAEVDKLIAEMTEIAESQMMFRHAEICELIRERIKVICNGK